MPAVFQTLNIFQAQKYLHQVFERQTVCLDVSKEHVSTYMQIINF